MNARSERGQTLVITVLFLSVLVGMAALVLDVGSWYRAHRDTQKAADAAALAGAQALPANPGNAPGLALQYADKNGGGLAAGDIALSAKFAPNDTIKVHLSRPADSFFAKLFGIDSITVGANATARAGLMAKAQWVAPIVVNKLHPKLSGNGCPCFGPSQQTTIPLGKAGAPGAFDLLNLDGSKGGSGPPTLADWILRGFDGYLDLGNYNSDPGAKWNSSQVHDALDQRIGTDLLFPVYDTLTGNGANAQYHVIGWVGFHLLSYEARGSSGSISGYFTTVIWQGIQVSSNNQSANFGAQTISLVD